MIKSYILTIILFVLLLNASACEICGCSNSNFQIGILPTFSKGFVGIRYGTASFHSQVSTDATQFSSDFTHTTELWGGYNMKKWQFMAFLPYLSTRKESDDGVTTSRGLGDALLLVNYKILGSVQLSSNEQTTVQNNLYVGGGIKLPTGVNTVDPNNPNFNIGDFNSQAGTGSVDYLMNLTHNIAWNRSGVVTNIAYRVNGANQQDYRFGNRTYLNMVYYYSITLSSVKVKPNAGINYQSNAINTFQGARVESSDGYNLNATVGVNFLYRKMGFNAMAFLPVAQNMYDGQTQLKSRALFGLTYSF